MKIKKLGLVLGLVALGVILVFGIKKQFKREPLPDFSGLIKEELSISEQVKKDKQVEKEQIQVKEEKPVIKEELARIKLKQEQKGEPLFVQRLKASGIEVKEYKEMSAMGKLMNEYYKNQGYPRLERKFNTQIPEGEATTSRIIVKEIDWKDDGSYSVRYYTVRVGDGQEVSAIENLKDEPSVISAEPDFKIKIQSAIKIYTDDPADGNVCDPFFDKQWGLTAIKAPQAWEKVEGSKDIKIAILDSGVDLEHPDLVDNLDLSLSCDYINDDGVPEDQHPESHGTHIAGIIAGKGFNGIGIHGVMNSATLIIHKILIGEVTDVPIITLASTISQAMVKGARVINMSWVTEDDLIAESATLKEIFELAFDNDKVLLVAAAGNGGEVLYPAKYPEVLSVGGVDEDGNVVGFEGENTTREQLEDYLNEVDVLAPGVNIYSTVVRENDGSEEDGYGYLSGTSQAAAFVSGLAGLILAKNPDLTKDELKQIITENAEDVFGLGKGLINAQRAVEGVAGGNGGSSELQAVAYVGEKGQKEITVDVGKEVQFYGEDSQATAEYNEGDLKFQWDFGDGETSDEMNPTHTYQEEGDYTVFLVVSVGDKSDADFVTVNIRPVSANEIWVQGKVYDEEGKPQAGITVWMCLKNKGGESLIYTNDISGEDGSYKIIFEGIPDPNAKYDVDLVEPENKENILTDVEAGNSYTYDIGNAPGNQHPVINNINYEPEDPDPGEEITFTVDATDPDGEIVAYNWDFGDGNTAEGQQVTHAYNNKGIYTVKVTVTDDIGLTCSSDTIIIVGINIIEPTCGNGECDPGESCRNCPEDCGSCGPVCGNGECESGETCFNCAKDCGECCGNGVCEEMRGEDCFSCPEDCGSCGPVCGNGECESGETCFNCAKDCGECCGNGVCEEMRGEDCFSCPEDCGSCGPVCGNGECESGETCFNCAKDCGECCGNGVCEEMRGEDCISCPEDCGSCGL